MDLAKAHNLKGPQVKALCMTVKDFTTVAEAENVTQFIDWNKWQPKFGETKNRSLRRAFDPRYKGAAVLDIVSSQIDNIAERVDHALKLREKIDPAMIDLIQEAEKRIAALKNDLGALGIKLAHLRNPPEPAPDKLPPADKVADVVEKSPDEIAAENRKLHESWGLKFTFFENDSVPTVHVNGKARYDLSDTICVMLRCVAERKSCDVLSAEQIADIMIAKGHEFSDLEHSGKEVRTAIREIDSFFKRFGKDNHVIVRTGGHKQVSFGLAV